ncbi:hypothetical protein MHC_03995 [Mycoplasma haemocanis str. Illinois]|uniref:Uncharacterized protein n=1 Tax=Mycoplasma haemocanis (strain Illinois) TaxID=1111676 RepID=H6N7N5_MYCHN|nr:hypothetical protein [Mycoplasma haemocanis]AEW45657.1 hypothetical protein MHC_03995 [Mycoplasma haemocanis str. Illinois]
MSSNSLYLLGALGTVSAAGGGIYFAYSNSKLSATIRDKLKKEGYALLSADDSTNWNKVLTKYNEAKNTPNKRFNIGTDTISLEDLKRSCESYIDKEINDDLYSKVKLWCTVPRSIRERLGDLKFNLLKTEGDDDNSGDKSKWTSLEERYRNGGNNAIKDFKVDTQSGADTWKKLRDECKKHLDKDRWDVDYDYYLDKLSTWCSDKK